MIHPGTVHGAITLGGLIGELEKLPKTVRSGPGGVLQVESTIIFDPWNLRPTNLASYRGFYEDLALDFEIGEPCPVVQLLDECRRAIGRQFEGYKGGLYTATRDTAIWCSHWGQAQNLVVTGIREIYEGYYGLETKVVDL